MKITSIKIQNFRRFTKIEIPIRETRTILVGDNECGKSTILSALDLVLLGSRNKIESIGLHNLFNRNIIANYLETDRKIDELPVLMAEIYLSETDNELFYGATNSTGDDHYGMRLIVEPDELYQEEIKIILENGASNFPFEFYHVKFQYFSDRAYTIYTRITSHLLLDNSQISNKLATSKYIRNIYNSNVELGTRIKLLNQYRDHKKNFANENLLGLNEDDNEYEFALRSALDSNLESDLNLEEAGVPIQDRGKGKQCFIKTDFALQKASSSLECVLLEEPENHLSHVTMRKLIKRIEDSTETQIIVATHSNMIANRLNLKNIILLNSEGQSYVSLKDLDESTARFFMKAPDNNMLEFITASRVILVEGDAEFILIKRLYENITSSQIEDSDVHIISVGGTSFPRYLRIASQVGIKVAVITDNDKDFEKNIVKRYEEFVGFDNIRVFADDDNAISTFEIAIHGLNEGICHEIFSPGRRTLSPLNYMLGNKAESAFQLLESKGDEIIAPEYIKDAIEWIRN